jgi:hypothetical protein
MKPGWPGWIRGERHLRLPSGLPKKFQRPSPLDGPSSVQFQLDFRTGRPTTITGPAVTDSERAACSALNARRVRGILQVSQLSPSRESLPPDVWAAFFIRKTREWDVPLISLSKLGLLRDEDGFLESKMGDLSYSRPRACSIPAWGGEPQVCVTTNGEEL